ncbi:hypothetical protein [Micromonospora matsumotoense]|uniref:hypothetical protein n=1 Tax=Micromonospora matsumotoense TaxID=121616 RepID=UPI0033C21246
MGTSVVEFLDRWDPGRRPDLPDTTSGTLRLDAADDGHTTHWRLTVRDQRVEVTRSAEDAELIVRADREVFDHGLRPCGDNLLVDSALPDGFGRIELLDVPGRWGRADAYGRDRSAVRRGERPRLR